MSRLLLAGVLVTFAFPVSAEVNEVQVAQQYGVSFLPLMLMERDKLVEKHAKAAGLPELRVNWAKVAGPSESRPLSVPPPFPSSVSTDFR